MKCTNMKLDSEKAEIYKKMWRDLCEKRAEIQVKERKTENVQITNPENVHLVEPQQT